jgi:hypothetical protein
MNIKHIFIFCLLLTLSSNFLYGQKDRPLSFQSPKNVFNASVKALKSGDVKKYINCWWDSEIKKEREELQKKGFDKVSKDWEKNLSQISFYIFKEYSDKNYAILQIGNNKDHGIQQLHLFKKNGVWKFTNTDFNEDENIKAVHIAAETAMINNYSITGFPVLITFLQIENKDINLLAIDALKQLTGNTFGYNINSRKSRRKKAINRWKKWWKRQEGKKKKLRAKKREKK